MGNEIDVLKRALERERKGKAAAERVIEQRIRELYLNTLSLESKIKKQEQSMSIIFDNMLDAVFFFDRSGKILEANKAAYHLVGKDYDRQDLNYVTDFSEEIATRIQKLLDTAYSEKTVSNFDFQFTSENGISKVVNIRPSLVHFNEEEILGVHIIATDVTSETILKKIQDRERLQLQIENEIFEAVLKNNDLFKIGWSIVKSIGRFLETDDVVLYTIIDDELVQIASLEESLNGKREIKKPFVLKPQQGIVGQVAQNKKARIVNDTRLESNYIVDQYSRLSEITVPILLDGELIGILDSEHLEKNHYKDYHLVFLKKVSNFIALGLKNSVNELKIQQQAKDLELSSDLLINIIENLPRGIAFENKDQIIVFLNQRFIDLFELSAKTTDIIGLNSNQARSMLSNVFPESERFTERTLEILEQQKIVTDDTLTLLDGRTVTRHYAPVYQNDEFIGNLWAYADNTIETRFYENLNYEREKYINIIANMEIGLLEVDNDDRIITANNAFLKMTDYSEEELIGKIGHEILVTKKEAKRIKQMNASRLDGESSIYEIKYLTKNNEERHMLVSGGPNRDIKGDIIGSIGIHLDISKLKELENLREELIKDLTESNDELTNYAHVVSHDLKTPLRSISAAMSWLKEDNQDKLDEMSKSYLEIVDESLIKMDKIIADTLRYSELKKKSVVNSEVDLYDLVDHLIKELSKSYPETEIQIIGELPVLKINETKAIQIFQNILDNACKYRDPERKSMVQVSCHLIFGFFEFQIEDNGIGIDKKHESRVFEIFQKLNNNKDSNGVGMSIVKKIVENYGGKIWFESEVGKGTTFKFNMPRSLKA